MSETLGGRQHTAPGTENLMPYILAAVREYATLGETTNALREACGEAEVLNIA